MHDPLWYGEQDENGVDLSLIRSNLERSPPKSVCSKVQPKGALWLSANRTEPGK